MHVSSLIFFQKALYKYHSCFVQNELAVMGLLENETWERDRTVSLSISSRGGASFITPGRIDAQGRCPLQRHEQHSSAPLDSSRCKKKLDKLPWTWATTLHVAHKMYSNVLFMAFHVYLYLQSVKNWPSFPTVSGKSWVQTARVFSDRACGQMCVPCGTGFEAKARTKHSFAPARIKIKAPWC